MLKRLFAPTAAVFVCTLIFSGASHAQTTTNVSVNSAVVVNATGVQVASGAVVMITATGTVDIADTDGPYSTDPNGTIVAAPDSGTGAYNYFTNYAGPIGAVPVAGGQKVILAPYQGQLNGAPFGALVAGFSANPNASGLGDFPNGFFLVGASGTVTAPIAGYLFLAVNDINNTSDDSGSFAATVTVEAPPIASIEFTQAIQQYQTLTDLKASLMANGEPPVPIIAGKPGVMRVYFTPVTSATTYNVVVIGPAAGTKTISLPPGCQATDQRAHNNLCPSLDFYFPNPPSGPWSVNIAVTDSNNNNLENETLNIISRTTASINLKGVSGCVTTVTPSASKTCGNPSALLSQIWMTSLLMPTASVKAIATGDNVADCLQCSSYNYPVWDKSLARQAHALYSASDALTDFSSNQWTDYFAVYSSKSVGNDSSGMAAGAPSHGAMGPDIGYDIGADATAQTVAHETGHTLSLLHTNVPVTTAATAAPGCWSIAAALTPPGSYWPYATNNIQDSKGLEDGFNVTTQAVIDPTNTFDLMAYCVPPWISPIQYNRMIAQLNGGTVATPSLTKRLSGARTEARATPLATPPTVNTGSYWQIGGDIDPAAGVTFDPVFTETIAGSTDPGSGTYSIQVLGSGGQVLYTRYFTPLDSIDDTPTGSVFVNPYFTQWVPVTAGAASFAVMDSNGNTVGTVPLTGVAPRVTITSPVAGFVGSNQQTISWTIIDPDSTTFTSRVLYSPDNGTTWEQVSQTTATSDTVDFSQVPGSSAGLIMVYVSDGVNSGSATSVPFNVPKKTPSTIVINSPANGYTQAAVDPMYLSGAVFDADDGVLTGTALQWTDNVQGVLGSGSPLTVKLQPGPHTLTLTGTDSDGNMVTATANVVMAGSGPSVTLTTSAIANNCVSATIAAKAGNQGAALSTVQYSLNGGANYTSIPLAQLPYSFVVPGSGSVSLVAVASDLSRQTAAQSVPVTLTGSCTTGTPSVSGGSAQIALVDAAFPTALAALVTDGNGNPVSGVAVNFTGPTSGASATFSPATATTTVSGIASTTATANNANGTYNVIATVPGSSTTAQFSLTNTDFMLAASESSITVTHGSSATATITVTPLSGFNSAVTLACSGLPDGVACSFSPATLTPAGTPLTSTLTVNATNNATSSTTAMLWGLPGGGLVFAFCLFGPGMRRRGKYLGIIAILALAAFLVSTTGCGGKFKAFTSTVTVTATSGTLQHTSSINLSVR